MLFVWCVFWVVLCWHVELVYVFELWFAQCGSKQLTKKWIGMSFYPLVWGGVKANLKSSYPSSRFQRQQLNHSMHCPRRMKRKHPHEHGSSIAQTKCWFPFWSGLICSGWLQPGSKAQQTPGKSSWETFCSYPHILTLVHTGRNVHLCFWTFASAMKELLPHSLSLGTRMFSGWSRHRIGWATSY